MNKKIHYCHPSITDLEKNYATDAAKNGWGEKCYDYIIKFENEFKKHLGVKYAIATSSCTGALHMGLHALGINKGDEVILADTNWIATAAPIIHLGATPVFVDICKETWCIDPVAIEKAINKNTRAIIAVHLYGNLCDMDKLLEIGKKYNLPIIEDSAEALGSVYKGQRPGSIGSFGTFSFHGTKTITTGEGGIFVTNNQSLYEQVLTLSNHGRDKNQVKQFWSDKVGFKYKMSNIQAAIGCAQLERIEVLLQRKKDILSRYKELFKNIDVISMNPEYEGIENGAWMPTVVFAKEAKITREILLESFFKKNIDARVFFWPLSSTPPMIDYSKVDNPNAYDIPSRSINLPSYHDMSDDDINAVASVIIQLLEKNAG